MDKNIVLCSDGTGNARGKSLGTNVSRLFKALDLSQNQVAFYGEGVGTADNGYLKAIGGAFGWGMKRDILDMYEFLAANYEDGDKVYVFGFSRGAYCARAVAGLITSCGIPKAAGVRRDELRERCEEAYDAFLKDRRASRWSKKNVSTAADAFYATQACSPATDFVNHSHSSVEFIGVWDTVDAMGMPIDELAEFIDFFFAYRFTNQTLSSRVTKACHAVAIDDQRHTFHPVLWHQDNTPTAQGDPRIEQVWFAGMHSNVGGSYPKDEMSYVPLRWMMEKAEKYGLTFYRHLKHEYRRQADPHGVMYDSRAGVAIGYRFKPRDIETMCQKDDVGTPKIHHSVLARICEPNAPYGPGNLPTKFEIDTTASDYAHQALGKAAKDYSFVKTGIDNDPKGFSEMFSGWHNLARFRRGIYMTVVWSLIALLVVETWADLPASQPVCSDLGCYFQPLLFLFRQVPFGLFDPAVLFLSDNQPVLILYGLFLIGAVISHLFVLKPKMVDGGIRTWQRFLLNLPKTPTGSVADPRWEFTTKETIRLRRWIIIPVFLLVLSFLIFGLFKREANETPVAVNAECTDARETNESSIVRRGASEEALTSTPCIMTSVTLSKGTTYHMEVEDVGDWVDSTIRTKAPGGFTSSEGSAIMHLAVPLRRHKDQKWFQLMAKVGDGDAVPITEASGGFIPNADGELVLYVNDAMCLIGCDKWTFYGNNSGRVCVRLYETGPKKLLLNTCSVDERVPPNPAGKD